MKVEVMRELILAIDTNQIKDEFVDAANVETMADVKKVAKDWNAQKKQAWGPNSDKDITDWAAAKK